MQRLERHKPGNETEVEPPTHNSDGLPLALARSMNLEATGGPGDPLPGSGFLGQSYIVGYNFLNLDSDDQLAELVSRRQGGVTLGIGNSFVQGNFLRNVTLALKSRWLKMSPRHAPSDEQIERTLRAAPVTLAFNYNMSPYIAAGPKLGLGAEAGYDPKQNKFVGGYSASAGYGTSEARPASASIAGTYAKTPGLTHYGIEGSASMQTGDDDFMARVLASFNYGKFVMSDMYDPLPEEQDQWGPGYQLGLQFAKSAANMVFEVEVVASKNPIGKLSLNSVVRLRF